MGKHEHELLRESPEWYLNEISNYIRKTYPLVSTDREVEMYRNGKAAYVSFCTKYNTREQQSRLFSILDIALARGQDTQDIAFAQQASQRNRSFSDSGNELRQNISGGMLSMQQQIDTIPVTTAKGQINAEIHDFVIEGERRQRYQLYPSPLRLAIEMEDKAGLLSLSQQAEQRYAARVLRASASEYGVPFSILTGLYFGLLPEDIIRTFDNPNVIEAILKDRKQKEGLDRTILKSIKFPHANEPVQLNMLENIRNIITVSTEEGVKPNYSNDAFGDALNRFTGDYFFDLRNPMLYQLIQTKYTVYPQARFRGLDEIAQTQASTDFINPPRAVYINKYYGDKATTRILQSRYIYDIEPVTYEFEGLLERK